MSHRLAIVLSHPTQYYSPWFRWMARHGVNLRVFYLWDFGVTHQQDPLFGHSFKWDVDLLSGYEHEFVPNLAKDPGAHHFQGFHNPGLIARLTAWAPEAVLLFGYKYRTHQNLIFRSRWPLIFRGDSHLLGQPHPSPLKRFALWLVYRRFAALTYVGEANRAYFKAFGVPEKKLFFSPHCVDDAHFTATTAHRQTAARLKDEWGLTGRRVALFAGKFAAAKQPLALLKAFIAVAPADAALIFVGEGEQKEIMMATAAAHKNKVIRFLPFANQSEMPARYLLADFFVLPSGGFQETWGLAVNEAMHMGVPCLVSDRVGCQQSLVTEGTTGWVFCAGSELALQAALTRAFSADPRSCILKAAMAARIAHFTYPAATEGLLKAVNAVCRPSH